MFVVDNMYRSKILMKKKKMKFTLYYAKDKTKRKVMAIRSHIASVKSKPQQFKASPYLPWYHWRIKPQPLKYIDNGHKEDKA